MLMTLGRIEAASVTVAAADSSDAAKAHADLICDGVDDQVELMKSLAMGKRAKVIVDTSPDSQQEIECLARHEVKWEAGTYRLSATLEIPDAADTIIEAEGTLLDYPIEKGDAVRVLGGNRCRYRLGTIDSVSSGAALRICPTTRMPFLMSMVSFTGLIGHKNRGVGLHVDHRNENVCVNQFTGTDIYGFDTGVLLDDFQAQQGANRPTVKSDTNWFWLSYVRMCNTCVWEKAAGVDSTVWEVNVDASIPGSTAIRTAGGYSRWDIIMGTYSMDRTNALILDPGADHQIIQMRPPIDVFRWQDHSGKDSNVFLATSRLPLRKAPAEEIRGYWNRAGKSGHEQRKKELEAMTKEMQEKPAKSEGRQ
jgi:hypothetical protein